MTFDLFSLYITEPLPKIPGPVALPEAKESSSYNTKCMESKVSP